MKIIRMGLATIALLALTPAIAAAYSVAFDYYAYASSSDGIPIRDDQTWQSEVYAAGSYTKTGDFGNYGTVSFVVDMMDRTVSGSGHSHGLKMEEWPHFASGTGQLETANFYDRVTFTAPAGTHDDGLYATMTGYLQGSVSSGIGAGARAQVQAQLGYVSHDTGIVEVGIDDANTIVVNESFTLVLELVAPGTTLNNEVSWTYDVRLGIWNAVAWSVDYNTGAGYVTGDGDFDFTNGLRITSLTASDGVRFVSQSGAFGDGVTAVPDAAAARLLQNRPNPFNPSTVIAFDLERDEVVNLRIFDVAGNLVRTLIGAERYREGNHDVSWRGVDEAGCRCASGVYFYRLETGTFTATKRMTLVE